jgi:hypothetical protein
LQKRIYFNYTTAFVAEVVMGILLKPMFD